MGDKYAHIRISTEDQNEMRQVIIMRNLGVPEENIVIEKESGKSTVRTEYRKLVKRLKPGDTLYIENIDRLSRDYDGIISEWHKLTKEKGVTIIVVDTPILNTNQTDNSLLMRFVRNLLLHIMAFHAETEWVRIKRRQAEGIANAKAEGKQLGRPKAVITEDEIKVANQYLNQEIPFAMALNLLGIKKSAFYELCQTASDMQNSD